MKLYSEEEVRKAIRFGFERSSLLDDGQEFIDNLDGVGLKPTGSRYDYRLRRDVITYERIW